MSLLRLIRQQLGLSNTAANNFTLTAEADDGTCKLARGDAGATTQDILTVNAAGIVKMPQNVVAFRGFSNTNQTGLSSGVATRAVLTDTVFDTKLALTLNTAKFQPTVAGYYQVSGTVSGAATGLTSVGVWITKNHPGGAASSNYLELYANTSISTVSVTGVVYLNGTTDYLELWGVVSGTSGLFLLGSTSGYGVNFSGHLLGAA